MHKIEAIIRPEKLTCVKDALANAGLVGISVAHVTGWGAQEGGARRGPSGVGIYEVDTLPKVKLEMVVNEAHTHKALDIIMEHARTGNIGDGKIFVTPVAHAIRIGTGERGPEAL